MHKKDKTSVSVNMSVLPDGYYHFFSKLEPVSTPPPRSLGAQPCNLPTKQSLALIGAALAIFSPEGYADDLFPFGLERGTRGMGGSVRGRILCGGLGNCQYCSNIFPKVKRPDLTLTRGGPR